MRTGRFIKEFLSDDTGQTTTEYILMLSVVVMIAMKFKTVFLTKITTIIDKVGGEVDTVTTMDSS